MLEFVDPQDVRPYLRFTGGCGTVVDAAGLARVMQAPESATLMRCLLPVSNGFEA
jgi:hypothetical protein